MSDITTLDILEAFATGATKEPEYSPYDVPRILSHMEEVFRAQGFSTLAAAMRVAERQTWRGLRCKDSE